MTRKKPLIDFERFVPACRFVGEGYNGAGGFDRVCRRRDRRPPNASWGICDEAHCPYFGVRTGPGEVFCNGKKVGEFTEMRFVMNGDAPSRF